jgi:flagellar biosynthesis/type III secretory pathway M-ring protein FliF/YscJ
MFILGLLILAAAVVFSVELILANREQLTIHLWNWTWNADAFWLAVAGAILLFAAVVAFGMMRISATRMRRMRTEHRMLLAEREQMMATRGKQPMATQPRGKEYPATPTASYPAAPPASEARAAEPAMARSGARDGETTEKHHRFFGRHSSTD